MVLPGGLFDPDLLEQRGEITNIACQIRDSVGRARNLLVSVRQIEAQKGKILYACRDVTERIKIELELRVAIANFGEKRRGPDA